MEESLAEFYFEELKKSSNPVKTLVAFYRAMFDIKELPPDIYAVFARLYKIYGSQSIYFALLDCADVPEVDYTRMSRLISYFAKKRLEGKFNFKTSESLNEVALQTLKKLEREKRVKVPDIFGENE